MVSDSFSQSTADKIFFHQGEAIIKLGADKLNGKNNPAWLYGECQSTCLAALLCMSGAFTAEEFSQSQCIYNIFCHTFISHNTLDGSGGLEVGQPRLLVQILRTNWRCSVSEERGCSMSHSLPPLRPLGKALPWVMHQLAAHCTYSVYEQCMGAEGRDCFPLRRSIQ